MRESSEHEASSIGTKILVDRSTSSRGDSDHAGLHNKGDGIDRNQVIRDIIIGFADGLTVPFALTAGLSSIGSTHLVILGGLAELFAGAISMGLGAWVAADTERKTYQAHVWAQSQTTGVCTVSEEIELDRWLESLEIKSEAALLFKQELMQNRVAWDKFRMNYLLRLDNPSRTAALVSALSMGAAYFLGGIIPMIPYFAFGANIDHALFTSIGITVLLLLAFGYIKAIVTGTTRKDAVLSAIQMLAVGTLAAGSSYGIVRGVNAGLADA